MLCACGHELLHVVSSLVRWLPRRPLHRYLDVAGRLRRCVCRETGGTRFQEKACTLEAGGRVHLTA